MDDDKHWGTAEVAAWFGISPRSAQAYLRRWHNGNGTAGRPLDGPFVGWVSERYVVDRDELQAWTADPHRAGRLPYSRPGRPRLLRRT